MPIVSRLALTTLLASSVAVVAPAAAKITSKAYDAALKKGRALAKKGQWAEAAKQFERAVAERKDDPTALSELGWALFNAGDLERADAVSAEAVKQAAEVHDRRLQAASLYNLGRVREKRGDRAGAAAAYRASLALRVHPAVRAQLRTLEGATGDALAPRALTGPFDSLEAWCAAEEKAAGPTAVGCELERSPVAGGPTSLAEPAAPWLAARVVGWANNQDDVVECALVVRTARGWFGARLGACDEVEFLDTWMRDLAARDALTSGEGAELVLRFDNQSMIVDSFVASGVWHDSMMSVGRDAMLVVCGVGASGVPSCTPRALVGREDVALEASFDGQTLRLEPKAGAKAKLPGDLAGERGAHALVFP